ncbi:hypothetical protein QUF58_05375 [Anaerolineales bacterium HSG24]|nr:hypothetical protein [Anaerolineales bacterium HSG24]
MHQTTLTITHKTLLSPAWWQINLESPKLAEQLAPGQFLLVQCTDPFTAYLRRPVFPMLIGSDQLALLLRPSSDAGLAWLLTRQVGDTLNVIGPLGQGFPKPTEEQHVCLISDSPALEPLLGQMQIALHNGSVVTMALQASRASRLYPISILPIAVELHVATLDGSMGQRGRLTPLLPDLLHWADVVYATGTMSFLHQLNQQATEIRLGHHTQFLYGLWPQQLFGCGLGACLSCVLPTKHGLKRACADGPVFDLGSVMTMSL